MARHGGLGADRAHACERDFDLIEPTFFSTSQAGSKGPEVAGTCRGRDARDLKALAAHDVLLSCQGSDYTSEIYPKLRAVGWNGYWIDAARTLRMNDDAVMCSTGESAVIKAALAKGVRNYIGGNCTVSCMLMGPRPVHARPGGMDDLHDLPGRLGRRRATYAELLTQFGLVNAEVKSCLPTRVCDSRDRPQGARQADRCTLPMEISWRAAGRQPDSLDRQDLGNGVSLEEWKGGAEATKYLAAARRSACRRRQSTACACALHDAMP